MVLEEVIRSYSKGSGFPFKGIPFEKKERSGDPEEELLLKVAIEVSHKHAPRTPPPLQGVPWNIDPASETGVLEILSMTPEAQ